MLGVFDALYQIDSFSPGVDTIHSETLPYLLAEILARSGHVDKVDEWVGSERKSEKLWR